MFLAKKLNSGAGSPAAPADAQFNYVTMLLHGDGTNGAQNNTFVDSSSNNFTITRNGNTTQGSFSPYGSNWSNYFNGSSSYLSTASNAAYQFGTGDFTIECWINMAAGTSLTAYWRSFVSVCGDAVFTNAVTLFIGDGASGSSVAGEVIVVIGSNNLRIYGGEDIRNLGWVHVAVTRSGTTLRLFVNGTQKSSGTNSSNINETSYGAQIGVSRVAEANYFIGYVSNVRIVKGTAVYTSAFTPSTTPLTAITNTSLLTCQSNRFVDNSASPLTITVNGTPSVQRFNPFGTSTAYSTSVIGGSGYFDGSGDYLSTPNSSSFAFGTGNFTVEFWYRGTDTGGGFGLTTGGSTGYWQLNLSGSTMYWQNDVGVSNLLSVSASPILNNAWNHVAVVRNSTTLTIYFNGVSVTSTSDSSNYSGTGGNFQLGLDSNVNYITGYIADYRIVKGTAVYTANFTPPTAPLTAITNTQLLLNYTNGAIYDNAMMTDLETAGNAQISTSVVKYGTGSMYFDGTGDALVGQNTPNISLSGNFTIEAWLYQTDAGQNAPQLSIGDASTSNGILLFINTSQQLGYFINSAGSASGTAPINTWHHIAVVRSGSTITTYLNGVTQNIVTYSATFSGVPYFGATVYSGVTYYGAGYMDDLRITKGYARYTADFTPPTAAFPNIGPT